MDRCRFLLTSLARAVAAPHAAMAQERGRVPRVGALGPRTRADAAPFVDGFLRGLRGAGWTARISASSIASRMASTTGYPIDLSRRQPGALAALPRYRRLCEHVVGHKRAIGLNRV